MRTRIYYDAKIKLFNVYIADMEHPKWHHYRMCIGAARAKGTNTWIGHVPAAPKAQTVLFERLPLSVQIAIERRQKELT